ncbi:uromodulin [Lingula anatina]|uniref:Uromodulin n=1 Tax=Lingula anatina TaxID=7574 RepID=A0A1S3JZ38_LINAN|nr:uromodulin [Lingula anatina]|eukprot:XP_013415296.1 uromodulin [Lingula anatina]
MPLRIILAVTGTFTTVLLSYFGVSSGLTGHVCNRTEERNFTRSVQLYRYCNYYRSCGFWGLSRCIRYRSCSSYGLTYEMRNVTVEYCCEGWSAGVNATNTSSCDIPVCTAGCGNNGECIAPDTCKCQPPYHGPTCNETYDPCQITRELAVGFERSTNNTNFTADPKCDSTLLRTWYKIGHSAIFHMPTTCPGSPACGTTGPVWVNTTNTTIPAGTMVSLEACVGSPDSCCESLLPVQIKNCTLFTVYYLSPTLACPQSYCFEVPPCLDCNRPVCPYGYRYDYKTISCKDIDECALENDGCRDTCINTHGSYYCECRDPGFTLSANRHTCRDINECAVNNGGCGDVCINTYGSYKCECNDAGFTLSADRHTCREIEWWEDTRLYPFGKNAGDNNTQDDLNRLDLSWINRRWRNYDDVCLRVKLLRAGFPFFNGRHYNVHICNNGVLQFKHEWKLRMPWRFGTRYWMNRYAQIAPFWGRSDATLFSRFSVNRNKTLVYYQVYEMNDGKPGTEAIIARATADVKHYTQIYKQPLTGD